eukprot:11175203-Lingulodinium_polyedra.AAC.1
MVDSRCACCNPWFLEGGGRVAQFASFRGERASANAYETHCIDSREDGPEGCVEHRRAVSQLSGQFVRRRCVGC